MKSNKELQLVTEYAEKFFDYEHFIDMLSDQLASRKISNADVDAKIQKYCRIHKGCNPDLILDDINTNAYYKMDYQNDVLRAGIKKLEDIRSNTMNNINGTSGKNTVTFNSAEEIYDVIHSGQDLYCIDDEIYLFDYNAVGAIAYYYLDMEELMELAQQADGYIASALGPGGYIIDMNLISPDGEIIEYGDSDFDLNYNKPGYELDPSDIYDFLERFVGKEFIYANVDDLV